MDGILHSLSVSAVGRSFPMQGLKDVKSRT